MRKLMKKKVSLLGKEVSVFVIVMVAMIGLATAALVPYLSAPITGNVAVESPINITGTLAGLNLTGVHGGETISETVIVTNNADVLTTTHSQINITSNYAWDIGFPEFDVLTITDGTWVGDFHIPATFGPTMNGDVCSIDSTGKILVCTLGDVNITANDAITYTVTATVNKAIQPDTYTFSVRAMA